jgi:hypothetical protein
VHSKDRWKKILAAQEAADREKDKAAVQDEADRQADRDIAIRSEEEWRVKLQVMEDRIRVMNDQMAGGRKLFPKTEKLEPTTVGVFSVSTKKPLQHPRSSRAEFRAYANGVIKVTFRNEHSANALQARAIQLLEKDADAQLEDALFSFVENCL